METRVLNIDDVLRERQRWCVPVYQRHYAWETGENGQLTRLWEDLELRATEHLAGTKPYPHYIGAIIVAETPNQQFGTVRQRLLVDGQQRITTFQLLLIALREVARSFDSTKLMPVIESYLLNEISPGMADPKVEKYKLWPSSFDRSLYCSMVDHDLQEIVEINNVNYYKNGKLRFGSAPRLLAGFHYLYESISAFIGLDATEVDQPLKRLNAILNGFLSGFKVVVIQLDAQDDAQEIFASLNGLGKPLTAMDLIRNDVFYRARKGDEDEEALFEGRWKTFEEPFWEEKVRQGRFNRARIDFFLGHVLVALTGNEMNLGKLAAEYQTFAKSHGERKVSDEVDEIADFVAPYRALIGEGSFPGLDAFATFLRTFDTTTFYPVILSVCTGNLELDERIRIFRLLESYLIRREFCNLTTKNYNNVVTRCLQRLRQDHSATSLAGLFAEMEGDATRFPKDAEVIRALSQRAIYGDMPTPRLRYLLQNIEHKKRTSFDESVMSGDPPTVEHIMPQKWFEKWPLPSGRFAPTGNSLAALIDFKVDPEMQEQIARRENRINSLGNLSLVTKSLNPSLGNEDFTEKKKQLAKSLLVLNREIGELAAWTEEAIDVRGIELANLAVEIWNATPDTYR